MTLTIAHARAAAWSNQHVMAVVKASPNELWKGWYVESWSAAIPPENIVALYANGEREDAHSASRRGRTLAPCRRGWHEPRRGL